MGFFFLILGNSDFIFFLYITIFVLFDSYKL